MGIIRRKNFNIDKSKETEKYIENLIRTNIDVFEDDSNTIFKTIWTNSQNPS